MLDVKRNRLDYGRLLIPPTGFTLRQAVATSYSVDLDTLLSIPVALYYAQTLEGQLQGKDVQLIRAIQHTAKLLTIYHQEGQVKVPRAARDIYAYFEDALVPITPSDAFTSFHPKTWVLRYENQGVPGDIIYRLIVLSRNLTFDRCWDVAAFLDGTPDSQPVPRNQPLLEFMTWLNEQEPFANSTAFLDELSRVRFSQADEFDDYRFHPIGIPGYEKNPTATRKATRLMCLSPFLHPKALETLAQNIVDAPLLLSRRDELERIPKDILCTLQPYCLSEAVVEGERLASGEEGNSEPMEQDLHAKVFLFDHDNSTTWFLGSANATKAAFERNVEFMLELKGTAPSTRFTKVRKQLLGNEEAGSLFNVFSPSDGDKDDEDERRRRTAIRNLEYAILIAGIHGQVKSSANEVNFDLSITLDFRGIKESSRFAVLVRPFILGVDEQLAQLGIVNTLHYVNISETALSRFLHIGIRDGDLTIREFLIRVEIDGIPSTRLDNIFKSIINSRDKFFTYLRFLLTDELSKEDMDGPPSKKGKHAAAGTGWDLDMPIFEQLLVIASRNPERLLEVDRVITSLREADGDNVIPEDFLLLWEIFKAAIPAGGVNHE
jgi:hypothetical protein